MEFQTNKKNDNKFLAMCCMTYVQKNFLTEINCNVYKYKHSSEIRGFRLDVIDLEKTLQNLP